MFPIRSPTVPVGEERIRVVLHDFNQLDQVDRLVETILEILHKSPIDHDIIKNPILDSFALERVLIFHQRFYLH